MATIGTTVEQIDNGGARLVVQNLGPGKVAVGYTTSPSVAAGGSGIVLDVGQAYEFPAATSGQVYAVADAAGTDVRVERV